MAIEGPRNDAPTANRGVPLWWILAAILLTWYVGGLLFSSQSSHEHPISYSAFLRQVRANNVAAVRITGDQITGTFVKPLPQPSPTVTPAPSYKAFKTSFPAVLGDPGIVRVLEQHKVAIDVSPPSTPWFAVFLTSWLPLLLLMGFLIWSGSAARGAHGAALDFGRAKPKRYSSDHPTVTFGDVAGADAAKKELQEEVDFLRAPGKYRELGARIPRGILLVGPPGTGKTLLARAIAGEAGVAFFSLSGSDFVEMFVGVGASRVRDLFSQAKTAAPAIVFIDELDAVGRRRGAGLGNVNDEREQTLNQLLAELDGFDERLDVIIMAATNRPDVLDPALLRPGRFDRQVVIELPDRQGREDIMRIHSRKLRLNGDVDLALLSNATIGFSGADLANLCNESALTAARQGHANVTMDDFEEALDKLRLGAAHPHLADPAERRVVAYHEAGHALVAWLDPDADPVHKVTIIPHGQALGQTAQVPDTERHNLSRPYLNARLSVMLAGRTSEETVFGDVTTGAENDLVEATALARKMVTRWGMGTLGLLAFKADEEQPFLGYEIAQGRDYSETMAARIDENVQQVLDDAHSSAARLLKSSRKSLDELAQMLLQNETLGTPDLVRILGSRAFSKPRIASDAVSEATAC